MKRKRVWTIAVLLSVLFSSFAAAAAWFNQGAGPSTLDVSNPGVSQRTGSVTTVTAHPESAADNRQSVPVRAYVIGASATQDMSRSFTGTVLARYQTNVAFRVSGKILNRHIEVGQLVEANQLLFTLDTEDYLLQQKTALATLAVANASVLQATAEEKRLRELRVVNAVSASEYERGLSARDIALAQQESAQKQLDLANNQLLYCELRADKAGLVMSVDAEAGQVVTAGMQVCSIAKPDELEAVVDIPENRIPKSNSMGVDVQFWSIKGLHLQGALRELSPIADPVTRTYRARFTLIDPPSTVRLGMTTTVSWASDQETEQIAIPSTAIFQKDGTPAVWVIDPDHGRIHAELVEIIQYHDSGVIVRSPLRDGQTIVSAGVQKLDEGMTVRIWEVQR